MSWVLPESWLISPVAEGRKFVAAHLGAAYQIATPSIVV
jgi:hypothetical protein